MAELKTQKNGASVSDFLAAIADPQRRADATAVARLMQKVTGEKPVMWGASIVGFGTYHYKYASGREGDWFPVGLSPRKDALTVYICGSLHKHPKLLERLGRHKTGQSCLYIKKLSDVDIDVLEELIRRAVAEGPRIP